MECRADPVFTFPEVFITSRCAAIIAQPIFRCDSDRDVLDRIVADVLERFGARLHAYCWMPNHLHLALQIGDEPLGRLMQQIACRYARAHQARLETTGHLFERRYHAVLVDMDAYLLALLRYIHLNPVKAGIVIDPAAYRWSSHRDYLGCRRTSWVTTDVALALFDGDSRRARARYATFISSALVADGFDLPLVGDDEPRVLGNDNFVAGLSSALRPAGLRCSLQELVERCCEKFAIDPKQLRSASRCRRLSRARALIAHIAIARRVSSLQGVAAYFHRDESSLRKTLERLSQEPEAEQLLGEMTSISPKARTGT